MTRCDRIQGRLAEQGITALESDENLRRHVADCLDCRAFLHKLKKLHQAFGQLPAHDAPDALLAKTRAAVGQVQIEESSSTPRHRVRRRWAAVLGGIAAMLAVVHLMPFFRVSTPLLMESELRDAPSVAFRPARQKATYADGGEMAASPAPPPPSREEPVAGSETELIGGLVGQNRPLPAEPVLEQDLIARLDNLPSRANAVGEREEQAAGEAGRPTEPFVQTEGGRDDDLLAQDALALADKETPAFYPQEEKAEVRRARGAKSAPAAEVMSSDARRFLAGIESLEGLSFQPAVGYWANTYIPGDPGLRRLEAQLRGWDRSPLRAVAGVDTSLEQTIAPYRQPFDAPRNAALALYLHADKAAIDGPSRLRVQVGLKGAARQGGHRPAMNIGVVLDWRGADRQALGPLLRAVLNALLEAKQPGDRFSLTLAGPGGGLLITPEQFRHGPLAVTLQELFAEPPASAGVDLRQALRLAADSVRQNDAAGAPLGSSLVWLLAAAPLGEDLAELEQTAHANAVTGITLSAAALGERAELRELQRLVLAGQGHLRGLSAPEAAAALVDRELYASSRVVARALRLRIRLAPGVKLIEVIGSQRLDEPLAQRVREQEQSINQRLARNLGIQADRGEDEEGIQIIIPHFYAGDDHVILLDVVAERPGPIADVTVRYKDLVYLRNNSASAQLALPAGERPPGPLERNVRKNHLALLLAQSAGQAGRQLAAGDSRQAIATLAAAQALWQGLRREVPAWTDDAELLGDERWLADYLSVLRSNIPGVDQQRRQLAASLQVAAYRKLLGQEFNP